MAQYRQFPYIRGRRLRMSAAIREMAAEHNLKLADFIAPVFVMEGENEKEEIPYMPGYYRYTQDLLLEEIDELQNEGICSILLFVKIPDDKKDNIGTEALNPQGLMQKAVRAVKKAFPK